MSDNRSHMNKAEQKADTESVRERQEIQNKIIKNGTIAGTAGFATSGAAVYLLAQRRNKWVTSISLPFRAFGVVAAGMMAGVIAAEHTSVRESRAAYDRTVAENQRFSHLEKHGPQTNMDLKDRALVWAKEHRWSAVVYGWGTSMAASMYYVNRQPFDFKQKVVQARMYAQVVTIIMLGAAGALATLRTAADGDTSPEEEKANMRERQMYRFKSGTPAAKRAEHTEEWLHREGRMPELPSRPANEPKSHLLEVAEAEREEKK